MRLTTKNGRPIENKRAQVQAALRELEDEARAYREDQVPVPVENLLARWVLDEWVHLGPESVAVWLDDYRFHALRFDGGIVQETLH